MDESPLRRPCDVEAKIVAKLSASKSRAKQFGLNLRSLIASSGLTQKEFADRTGLHYNWVRKSCNDGIARSHPQNAKSLTKICDYFNLSQMDMLWGRQIASIRLNKEDIADQHREFVDDLNWLLQEFPDDHNVGEAKRVICEVVEYIRCPSKPKNVAAAEEHPQSSPMGTMSQADRFKTNLRDLIDRTGMTQKAFADRLAIPYIWLRKSCTKGVARSHPKNVKYIQAISDFFKLRDPQSLWSRRLDAKRVISKDEVVEEHRTLVGDLIWLLKEHGDTEDRKVRSHVDDVKRVIAAVVRHLYVSKEKPKPVTDKGRTSKSKEELSAEVTRLISASSPISHVARKRPSAISIHLDREMRPVKVDRREGSYVDDTDYLDDQIDRDMQGEPSGKFMTFDDWVRWINENPTPERIEEYTRLTRWAEGLLNFLPDTITESCRAEFLTYHVLKLDFEGMSLEGMSSDDFCDIVRRDMPEILLRQSVSDFMKQLPESVRGAVDEYESRTLVENRLQSGMSIQEMLQGVNRMAERRGVIANPALLKKHKRIRRRKITRHEPKQKPDS